MKEMELKYGCNPNQKPSRIFMEEDSELPIQVLMRKTGLYQFPGRLQRLAAGKRIKGGHRASRGRIL